MIEQIVQSFLIIAVIGLILLVLYQLFKAISGLFLIGLVGIFLFMEVYGIYLFFTERSLYVEDLATNGLWSFTTFYLLCNILMVLGIVTKIMRRKTA